MSDEVLTRADRKNQPWHRLSNVDYENKTADCSRCGTGIPLQVYRDKRPNGLPKCRCLASVHIMQVKIRPKMIAGNRKKRYGLSAEDYDRMVDAQGGCCAICKAPTTPLQVDHNHITGKVRRLLCRRCNLGLGYFQDDPIRLAEAIVYINENT